MRRGEEGKGWEVREGEGGGEVRRGERGEYVRRGEMGEEEGEEGDGGGEREEEEERKVIKACLAGGWERTSNKSYFLGKEGKD